MTKIGETKNKYKQNEGCPSLREFSCQLASSSLAPRKYPPLS